MLAKFYDAEHGGFWQSAEDSADLIMRVKEDYDGAEPSGNSVAVLSLLRLGAITDRLQFKEAAEKTLQLFSNRLQELPQAVPHLLLGLGFSLQEPRRVVIVGERSNRETVALLRATHSVYQPHKVVLAATGPVEPFARTLVVKDNHPTAYVCTGTACQPPTHDPANLKQLLK